MKRYHLFEFEDYSWFPKVIRDGGTDFLGFMLNEMRYYEPAIPILEDLSRATGHHHIIDLCSGNGGPISLIEKRIDNNLGIHYTLSDKFPNIRAYQRLESDTNGIIGYQAEPLDILKDTIEPQGIRTLFTAIHHFNPKDVKTILSNAVNDQMPIAIFDGGNKHIGSIIIMLITHPILFFFCTPLIKPFKWSRLLFTYLIPLKPIYAIWDGIVSILRLHTPEELLELAKVADADKHFNWSSGKVKNKLGFSMTYLVGSPRG